uniref:PARP catalytic domain-containing protein n=1 Tax=Oncorhynchus mykiss TaxID=8022 RepID=A0A8C7NZE8_ONCMY
QLYFSHISAKTVSLSYRSRHRHLQSGVTPEDSHVYVMYHGTSKQIAVKIQRNGFEPSKDGMLGAGVYLSRDIRKAIKYPIGADDSDRMVLKVKVDVGKVKIIDVQGHDRQYDWHTYGYDTAWVPPGVGMVPSNQQENCVYDPKRIKVMALLKVAILKKYVILNFSHKSLDGSFHSPRRLALEICTPLLAGSNILCVILIQ